MHASRTRFCRTCLVWLVPLAFASAQEPQAIRFMGVEARLNPERRDEVIRHLAGQMQELGIHEPQLLEALQREYQYALMHVAEPAIYDTLAPETIDAVDDALEALFDLSEISRSNRYEPLVYAYGFFNRDVTPAAMRQVIEQWEALSERERAPLYPTYIHTIDAVTKPLSMGPLANEAATSEALRIAVPMLKQLFMTEPGPGTKFHVPTHAALVLGPLWERWHDHPEHASYIREQLGEREAFAAFMTGQLASTRENADEMGPMELRVYGYSNRYTANALARLGVVEALPALLQTRALFAEALPDERLDSYMERALITLGDPCARARFESMSDGAALPIAEWLVRNGQEEARAYGLRQLAARLDCPPEEALAKLYE